MAFNLWDVEVGKQLGHFENEKDAMTFVQKLVAHYGEDYAGELGLGRIDDDGHILEPLSGEALLSRSREVLDDCSHGDSRQGEVIGSRLATAGRSIMKRADDIFGSSRIGRVAHASANRRRR